MSENPMIDEKNEAALKESFEAIAKGSDFEVTPQKTQIAFEDNANFKKLDISLGQKMQVSMLVQQIPQLMSADTFSKAYKITFPKGLPHTLTALKQGGLSSLLRHNAKIAGNPSLSPLTLQAMTLGAFTAMSAVTGQYFLKKLNSELDIVSRKLDDILGFLYGDKKAELIAEIGFVKYAYANYKTIMMSPDQRAATISSLQAGKKVALKDIEFYLTDLEMTVNRELKDYADLCSTIEKTLQLKDSIEMSRQLYVISGMLELYYSQNFEPEYIDYIEADMIGCINRCDQQLLGGLSKMEGCLAASRMKPRKNDVPKEVWLEKITAASEPYRQGNDSPIRVSVRDAIDALNQKNEFYFDADGNVYARNN